MPLFEYACRSCGHHFEYLTRAGGAPSCPACASSELEKQLSVFAVNKPGGAPGADTGVEACGTCGDPAGSCAVRYPTSSLN